LSVDEAESLATAIEDELHSYGRSPLRSPFFRVTLPIPKFGKRLWRAAVTEITHRTVEANGIRIHMAEAGEGPLVVLCHGFPES